MTESARRQLDELYRYQADAVRRSLTRRVGRDAAEDLVSRAFVKLAQKLEVQLVKDAPALLGAIVAGLEKDYYRDRDRQREREVLLGDDLTAVAEANLEHITTSQRDHDFRVSFDQAVRGLGDAERDAFILTELRGLPEREAATVLGVSQPTVHRRAEAARTQLREELLTA